MTLIPVKWTDQEIASAVAESEYICGLVDGIVAGQPALINALISPQLLRERLNLGGIIRSKRTIISDDVIVATDYSILVDATNNTVTLLFPANPNDGQIFNIFCINSTFTCTVSGNGKNMNGSANDKTLLATESITAQYDIDYGWLIT